MPSASPVTVAISRRLKPGSEAEFERWVDGIISEGSGFPGFLGSGYIRPAVPDGEHTVIYRFDTPEHFEAWQSSEERLRWSDRSSRFIVGEPHVEKATGLEYWFHDPRDSSDSSPPRWKQALLTWVGLYPTVLLVAYTVGAAVSGWSIPLRSALTTGLAVPIMTWAVMPFVTKLFRRWLRPTT